MYNDCWRIEQTVDLSRPLPPVGGAEALMLPGDCGAHVWRVTARIGGEAADLSTWTEAAGLFMRADGVTVACPGEVGGGAASVTLGPECLAVEGPLRGVLRLTDGERAMTLKETQFYVRAGMGDAYVPSGEGYMSLNALNEAFSALRAGVTATEDLVAAMRGRVEGTVLYDAGAGSGVTQIDEPCALSANYGAFDALKLFVRVEKADSTAVCDDVITLDAGALAAANGFAKVKLSDLSTFSPQTDKGVMLCELRLQFSGAEFRVKGVTRWLWTGAAADGAQTGINAFSGSGLGQVRIRRIVGYARTEDAEIADARLGADGVRYSTLGEALRRQIGALERRVAALEGGGAS